MTLKSLIFSVDELQVDGGSRAEQAMGFGLYIISDWRHTNVELLNELKEQKHRDIDQNLLYDMIMCVYLDSRDV